MKLDPNLFNQELLDKDPELRVMLKHLEVEVGMRTLDLGCCTSKLSSVLERVGCEAWGIDLNPYTFPLKHFVQTDFFKIDLNPDYFDVVIDISAVHHFGMPKYDAPVSWSADKVTAGKVRRALKPDGAWFLAMDRFRKEGFHPNVGDFVRQYDLESFSYRISRGFKVEEMRFYDVHTAEVDIDSQWIEILYAKLRKEE